MLGEDMISVRDTDPTVKERACSRDSAVDCLFHRLKERQRRLLGQSMHTEQPEGAFSTLP